MMMCDASAITSLEKLGAHIGAPVAKGAVERLYYDDDLRKLVEESVATAANTALEKLVADDAFVKNLSQLATKVVADAAVNVALDFTNAMNATASGIQHTVQRELGRFAEEMIVNYAVLLNKEMKVKL